MMKFYIVTACPEAFPGVLGTSLIGKALNKIWTYELIDLHDFGIGKHKKIDDAPYGGGPGLVLRADVVGAAIDSVLTRTNIDAGYYMSPKGILMNQFIVKAIVSQENILLVCGRFEGIDERIVKRYNLIEISIGEYVLSNGDLAAAVLMDSVIRLLPCVIGNQKSYQEESFYEDYSHDYSVYTRPEIYHGISIPPVLKSGNHKMIKKWRQESKIQKLTNIQI